MLSVIALHGWTALCMSPGKHGFGADDIKAGKHTIQISGIALMPNKEEHAAQTDAHHLTGYVCDCITCNALLGNS